MVYLQVDLICEGDSEGNGVKVTPRIGYNCHNILMEEMEKLVEASSGCEGQYLAVYNQNLKIYLYSVVAGVSSQKIQKKPTQRRPPFSIITNLKPT